MINCPNPPFQTVTIFPNQRPRTFSEIQGPNPPSNGWGRRREPWVFGRCRAGFWPFVSCQSETGNIVVAGLRAMSPHSSFWLIFCWEEKLEIQFFFRYFSQQAKKSTAIHIVWKQFHFQLRFFSKKNNTVAVWKITWSKGLKLCQTPWILSESCSYFCTRLTKSLSWK